MYYILEFIFTLIITYFFIKSEKPKLKFLFYGYIFFIFTLFLRIPFKFLEILLLNYYNSNYLPLFIVISSSIIITEIAKYLSLKKFLKTKSFKNGILFGIGWTTLESISIVSLNFFNFIFNFFNINYTISTFFGNLNFLEFGFIFIFNLAVTVLIVISIIKKNTIYLFYSILISLIVYFTIRNLNGINFWIFVSFTSIYSLYILFKYKHLK